MKAWLPPRFKREEGEAWLARATHEPKLPHWEGQDICIRPAPTKGSHVTTCYAANTPHRHCECGEVIDLEHGYCTDCIASLMRGAAMTPRQSEARKTARLLWLEKFGFYISDLEALLRRGMLIP